MAQKIRRAGIFGRLGSALGEGLAGSFDKGMERGELASDLKRLQNEDMSKLTPTQRLLKSSTPATLQHPQFIQSLGKLAEQEARAQGLIQSQKDTERQNPFEGLMKKEESVLTEKRSPSLTREEHLREAQRGAIPPTQEEIYKDAGRMYQENPKLFSNDPQRAIEAAESSAIRKQNINEAHVKQHERLQKIQDNVTERLQKQFSLMTSGKGKVPYDVYSNMEDEVVNSVLPKDQGGRGLTEQEAIKEYGKKLQEIDRQYNRLEEVPSWMLPFAREDSRKTIEQMEKSFGDRGDSRNLAEKLRATKEISSKLAYSLAQPVYRVPELNKELKTIPSLGAMQKVNPEQRKNQTMRVMKILTPMLGTEGSPLALINELENKGYDGQIARKYMIDNQEKMNDLQKAQLEIQDGPLDGLNDRFFKDMTGIK